MRGLRIVPLPAGRFGAMGAPPRHHLGQNVCGASIGLQRSTQRIKAKPSYLSELSFTLRHAAITGEAFDVQDTSCRQNNIALCWMTRPWRNRTKRRPCAKIGHSGNASVDTITHKELDAILMEMRVSDVAGAFFNVPLHPNVWPFFCRFFSAPDSVVEHFHLHTSADFGVAGMPGIFHLL